MKYQKILGHLGALLAVACWGISFISTKVLLESAHLTPIEVFVYRFAIAYVFLFCITFKQIFAHNWKDELQLMFCGVCACSLYYILENYALQYTTTGNVSLLSSISPLMTTALMVLVFRKKVGAGVVIGSVIAFIGVGFVIFGDKHTLEINPLGDLLALASALSWAIYSIASKNLIPVYNTLFITRKLFLYGVLTALPFMFLQRSPSHFSEVFSKIDYLFNLGFLALFCSLISFVVWNFSMRELGPVNSNKYIYMIPIVTLVAAYIVFGEQIAVMGWIGCAMVIGGLVVTDKLKIKSVGIRHIRK